MSILSVDGFVLTGREAKLEMSRVKRVWFNLKKPHRTPERCDVCMAYRLYPLITYMLGGKVYGPICEGCLMERSRMKRQQNEERNTYATDAH